MKRIELFHLKKDVFRAFIKSGTSFSRPYQRENMQRASGALSAIRKCSTVLLKENAMKANELIESIKNGKFDRIFTTLYGKEQINAQRERYLECIEEFGKIYNSERDMRVFSVSGRSEIAGNHTDHNYGKVLAASINLDIIAVVSKSDNGIVNVKSKGFQMDTVDINDLAKDKYRKSALMIAGVCKGFCERGYKIGGFDAYTTSNVFKASGLSSSAAFEDMIGTIQNHLYNDGKADCMEIAKIGQYAENEFYDKPCGLLDQVACIYGGIVAIDFADPKNPSVEKLDFDLSSYGYNLCIVNTGGNHSDLTDDYASIPEEMKKVAAFFGKDVLRDVSYNDIISNAKELREKTSDRAVCRAIHYITENARVDKIRDAVKAHDINGFLQGVTESGNSSFKYLQNVYTTSNVDEQGLSLALAVAEQTLIGKPAACRVHGGGFAGTIQVFARDEDVPALKSAMDSVFGEGSCVCLTVRPYGGLAVDEMI